MHIVIDFQISVTIKTFNKKSHVDVKKWKSTLNMTFTIRIMSPCSVVSVDPGLTNIGFAYAAKGVLYNINVFDIKSSGDDGSQQWDPEVLSKIVKEFVELVPVDLLGETELVIENQYSLSFQSSGRGINEVVGAIIMAMRTHGVMKLRRMSPSERQKRLPKVTLPPTVGKTKRAQQLAKYRAVKKASVEALEKWIKTNDCDEHRAILQSLKAMKKKDDACDAALNALVAIKAI